MYAADPARPGLAADEEEPPGFMGPGIVVIMSILAIAGPWLAPYTYADQDLTAANAWPSAAHWFGTDSLGRDLLVRVLYGARISLSIGSWPA